MWGNGGGVAKVIAGPERGAGRRLRMENPPVSPVNLHRNPVSWLVGIFGRLHGNSGPWGDAAAFHTHSHARVSSQWEPIDQQRSIPKLFLGKEGYRELGALTQIRMSSLKPFFRLTSWV